MSEPSVAPWISAQAKALLAQRGHAWLLAGPSGLGQYSLALELVRAWLCDAPTEQGACGACGSCHAIPGVEAARGSQGPSLRAFGKRSYIAGHIPNRPDALARWLVAPSALVPDTAMPSMGVSLADARDMAAYLRGLE